MSDPISFLDNLNSLKDPAFADFLSDHFHSDPSDLALRGVYPTLWIQQLKSRQKLRRKFPDWAEDTRLMMPGKLNIEQASSPETAQFKSHLFHGGSGGDLTGGMGVDSFFLSPSFQEFHYVEMETELFAITQHNMAILRDNVQCHEGDGLKFLKSIDQILDLVYLDPHRRNEGNKKVFLFRDCTPNVIEHLEIIRRKSKNALIKASPVLDIHRGVSELGGATQIWVVSVDGEVKELLFHLGNRDRLDPPVHCVEIRKRGTQEWTWEKPFSGTLSLAETIGGFLYEPYPSIMKAGMWDHLLEVEGMRKIHPQTHLFIHSEKKKGLPAQVYRILETFPFSKKAILPRKANVKVRNAKVKANEIEKKWKIQPGGDEFVFLVTDHLGKQMFILSRLEPIDS